MAGDTAEADKGICFVFYAVSPKTSFPKRHILSKLTREYVLFLMQLPLKRPSQKDIKVVWSSIWSLTGRPAITSLFVDEIFTCQYSWSFNLFCLWSRFYLHLHLLTIVFLTFLIFLNEYPITKTQEPIRFRDNKIFIKIFAEK